MFFLTKTVIFQNFTFYCFCCILVNFWAIFAHFTILEFSKTYLLNATQYVWFKHVILLQCYKNRIPFFICQSLIGQFRSISVVFEMYTNPPFPQGVFKQHPPPPGDSPGAPFFPAPGVQTLGNPNLGGIKGRNKFWNVVHAFAPFHS